MSVKRELYYVYRAIFRGENQVNIKKLINYYDEYNDFRQKILGDLSAPSTIKTQLVPIRPPKYIIWLKKFVKE